MKKCVKYMRGRKPIHIQKAIAVASMYPYYDMYAEILTDLFERFRFNRKLNTMQTSLFEQHVFNIVFRIPVPIRNKSLVRYPLLNQKFAEI